jgi:ribosomal protein L29
MTNLKERSISSIISTIASTLAVGATVWVLMKPALVQSISVAVADDFQTEIKKQTAPVQSAFKIIILSDINKIKKEIARLEFIEDHRPQEWSESMADDLESLKQELLAYREAYGEL